MDSIINLLWISDFKNRLHAVVIRQQNLFLTLKDESKTVLVSVTLMSGIMTNILRKIAL